MSNKVFTNSPSDFAKAVHGDNPLVARVNLLRLALTIPSEDRSMDEVILRLIRVDDGQVAFRKGLLRRCYR